MNIRKIIKEELLKEVGGYDDPNIMATHAGHIMGVLSNSYNDYLPQQEMEEGYDSYMDDVHEEEKWIQKAIEKPGSLRKKMGLKKGEKLTSSDIKSKLDSLKAKDKDPNKKGVQGLGKRDLKTYRQLNLAKTLRGL